MIKPNIGTRNAEVDTLTDRIFFMQISVKRIYVFFYLAFNVFFAVLNYHVIVFLVYSMCILTVKTKRQSYIKLAAPIIKNN